MVEPNSSLKDFVIIQKLGEGSFSQVFKVKRIIDQQEYALKKVKMAQLDYKEKQSALNEIRILASIQSEFIVSYKDAFFDDKSNTLCIVMELASDGDMLNKISKAKKTQTLIQEKEIWKAFKDMAQGLKILHEMKIYHRDLKGANIFIGKDQTYKLGDLNVSKVAKNEFVRTQTGTPYYCCPEIWNDQPYDSKCDIWSLGCILYEMAALRPPFQANDMKGLVAKVKKGVHDQLPKQFSADLNLIVHEMLKVNPKQRPSVQQLLFNPIVMRRITQDENIIQPKMPSKMELLKTIVLPSNLSNLKANLPKAKYNQEKLNISVEKQTNKNDQDQSRIGTARSIQRTPSLGSLQPKQQPPPQKQTQNKPQTPQSQQRPTSRNIPIPNQNQYINQNKQNEIPKGQNLKPPMNPSSNKLPSIQNQPQQNTKQNTNSKSNSRQTSKEKSTQNNPQKYMDHIRNNSRPQSGTPQKSIPNNLNKQQSKIVQNGQNSRKNSVEKNNKVSSRQNSASKRR